MVRVLFGYIMYELINEQIEVFVDFSGEGPVPIAFNWRGRNIQIELINFVHTSKLGGSKQFHYSVSTHTETYKITLNSETMDWTLNEIYLDSDFSTAKSLNDAPKNKKPGKKNNPAR
jgi:hypothetical protein